MKRLGHIRLRILIFVLTIFSEVLVEPAYAGEKVATDLLPLAVVDTVKKQLPDAHLQEDEPSEEDLEDIAYAGNFFALINPELSHNWQKDSAGNINKALKFELYSMLGLQITDNLDFKLEATLDTQGDGNYLALKKPLLEIESLAFAYEGNLIGVGAGKF